MCNSWLLNFKNDQLRNHLEVRIKLAELMVQKHHTENVITKRVYQWTELRQLAFTERYFPEFIPQTEAKDSRIKV
jgi:hypothetical protein